MMKMSEADEVIQKIKLLKETSETAMELRHNLKNDEIMRLTGHIIDYLKPLTHKPFEIDVRGTELEDTFGRSVVKIGNSITYEEYEPYSKIITHKHIAQYDQICKLLLNHGQTVVKGVRKSIQGDMELLVALLNRSIGLKYGYFISIELPRTEFYTFPESTPDKPNVVAHYISVSRQNGDIYLYFSAINNKEREYKNYQLYRAGTGDIQWSVFMQTSTEISNALEKWLKTTKENMNNIAKNEQWVLDSLTKMRDTMKMAARLLA